jgi:nitrogenase molybdenum-iron protein alpha chain
MKNALKIERAAPPREERLQAGAAFCGSCGELRARMGLPNCGCLSGASRSFSQGFGCQFTLSLGMLCSLINTVVVVHGPVGCGFWTTAGAGNNRNLKRQRYSDAQSDVWISTALDELDCISGGENKLREAVLYADREFRPEAIVVATSCVPALIGDDVDAILENLQNDVSAELVAVNCEGFKTKLMATAYDAVYNGILKNLTKKIERETYLAGNPLDDILWNYNRTRTVNVLNVGSMGRPDELELQRLLQALELKVNFIPCYSRPRDFRAVLDAALNISICGTHDDYYVKAINEHFGIPYIIDTMPIGRKATARWIRRVAEFFHEEEKAEALIKHEDAQLDAALEPYRAVFRGKRVYVSGGEVRVWVTAELMRDLGLEIAGIKGHHVDKFMEIPMGDLDVEDNIYVNIASQQPFEQANLINRLKPDVILMHSGGGNITAKHGVPVLPLFGTGNNYMGYTGAFEVAWRLKRALANSRFNHNIARYRKMPYRQEWLAKDPGAYIKDRD